MMDAALATTAGTAATIAVATSGAVTDAGALAASGVAIITCSGLVWRGGRRVFHRLVDRLDERIEERNAPLVAGLDEVRAQLRPNHGTSARDAIDRVASTAAAVEVHIGNVETRLIEELEATESRLGARIDAVETAIQTPPAPETGDTTP